MATLDNDDPLNFYLRELASIRPLTRDEETELLQQVRTQDAQAELAAKRLIEANLSLVVSIAKRYSTVGFRMLDLIEKGNEGLLLALKTFAGNPKDSFSAHAATCIEHAISKVTDESKSASE